MSSDLSSRYVRSITGLFLAALLAGCGDGRGQQGIPGTPQPTLTGIFVDSPVSGATWKASGGTSGITNSLGEFQYVQPEAGTYVETVTFSVGDIVLGTVEGIPFKGDLLYVTAVELTGSIDPLDPAATNQLVFIQSIDSDQDPTNGITISEATREAAVGVFDSLSFPLEDFSWDSRDQVVELIEAIAPGNRVVTDTEALDHFYTTYAALGGTDTFIWLFPGYPPVGDGEDVFQLVFADEFDTDGPPNPEVWNIDLGYGQFGWGNDEWQRYTDSPDNLRVENGNLVITALCNEPCGKRDESVTSARITTNDKYEFKYGKVVARIKVPVGSGTWPAFWSLGKDFPDVAWPRVGEIDFMEVAANSFGTDTTTSAMHWCDETIVPNPNANCFAEGGRRFVAQELDIGTSLADEFQIWEADWNADRVIVSINGIKYFELNIDPATMEEFRREFFLLLNVAVGGTLGGTPDETATWPQTMLVDYVRVYQQVDDISPPELTAVTIASDNANPAFAKAGDTVTVALTANEAITTPDVTIGGLAATTVTGSGTDWRASRVLTAQDAEGVVEFLVKYEDLAGNVGVPTSASTDASSVTLDVMTPVVTTTTIASNNAIDASLATAGDIVTVTLNVNEAIATPVVTIGGAAATAVGSGANWSASRTLTAGEAQGVITFVINYADFAGNAGVPVTNTTDASSVTVDTIAPTVAIAGEPEPPAFTTLDPIPLQFTFSEPVIGFEVGDIQVTNGGVGNLAGDGTSFTADVTPTGIGNLTVGVPAGAAADATGNASEAAADVGIMNMIPVGTPQLTSVSIASDNANTDFASTDDVVTVAFIADRDIQNVTVTIADAVAKVTGTGDTYQATRMMLDTDPEGPIAFAINFEDLLGTPGLKTTVTTDGSSVEFDVTPPTLAIQGLPTELDFLDPILVTFQFGEDVSGFDVTDIDVTNGSAGAFVAVDAAVYTAEITPDGVGDLAVAVAADVATDAAGNGNETASETSTVGAAWGLVWADDFEVNDPALLANWTARTSAPADCPDPCDGVQTYQTEQVSVNGVLTITAADTTGFGNYVSGVIDTRSKRALKYGRVEIDAVMPGNLGTLPSLRLLPVPATPGVLQDGAYGPWPQSGELDIVNAPSLDADNTLEHTLRYGLPEPEDTTTTAVSAAPGIPTLDTIEYAIEWEEGEVRWFVNDVHVATQKKDTQLSPGDAGYDPDKDNWYAYYEDTDGVYQLGKEAVPPQPAAPFDQDFYVVIGLAVGNNADSFFPQTLQVDAVRVYECVNGDPTTGIGCSTGTGVPPVPAPSEPYIETLEVYTDAPATLVFEEPNGNTTTETLVFFVQDDASFTQESDGTNIIVRATFGPSAAGGAVTLRVPNAQRYIDLSGGDIAGELLFRMRVNSADPGALFFAGLKDREGSKGSVPVDYVVGEWRNYSVKLADIVATSTADGSPEIDLADLDFIFGLDNGLGAGTGAAEVDLDDISVKVACRDAGGCEATPRSDGVPATVVYTQDFESLDAGDPDVLGTNGSEKFLVFADVWDGEVGTGIFKYQYGPFAAPNGGPGFSAIANNGEGGVDQGLQYLNIYSDYDNADHTNGNGYNINTSVFREKSMTADDIGLCWTFTADYKAPFVGGIAEPGSNATANAFFVTLDPGAGFSRTNNVRFDTTAASNTEWASFSISLDTADSLLIGQLLQFGFNTTAANEDDSGVYYDNLVVTTRPGACPDP